MTRKESKSKSTVFDYSNIASEIKAGRIRPIYLITGDEEYLLEKITNAIKRKVLAEGSGEADLYVSDRSGSKTDADELRSLSYTPPFLSKRRMTILKETGLFSERYPEAPLLLNEYIDVVSNIPDFSCLIFLESKVDKRRKVLIEAISERGVFVQIDRQSENDLEAWVIGLLRRDGIRISPAAVSGLIERTEKQMGVLEQEIKKLALFAKSTCLSVIDIDAVDQICIPDIRGSVFKMTDAIGMRKTEESLLILEKLIALKEPIPKIRFMLSRHVRQLICAKEMGKSDAIIESLGVRPFVARNLLHQSAMFTLQEIVDLYKRCRESDAMVKSGRMEERQALEWIFLAS